MKTKLHELWERMNQEKLLYLSLYNGEFGASIQISDLDVNKPIMAQLKRLNGNSSFNHYRPANYLAKNVGIITFSEETIDRFEKLFDMFNDLFR